MCEGTQAPPPSGGAIGSCDCSKGRRGFISGCVPAWLTMFHWKVPCHV